jgi:hypothetical protein
MKVYHICDGTGLNVDVLASDALASANENRLLVVNEAEKY